MGAARTFETSVRVHELIQFYEKNKLLGVICASPIALRAAGVGKGRSVTSHPAVKPEIDDYFNYLEEDVIIDGKLITSRGPGTSFLFALTLVEQLVGKAKRDEVQKPMMMPK
jgi:protein DJ-1